MRKLFTVLPICVALLTPAVALYGQDEHHDDQQHRYYDKKHKDYHQWNADEDKDWHDYLDQQHRKYMDFDKAGASQQQKFWNWEHSHHPDRH